MNDKSRSKFSLEVLTKVYATYAETRDFIDRSLEYVCSRDFYHLIRYFLFVLVLSDVAFTFFDFLKNSYINLRLLTHYCDKAKKH